MSQPEAAAEVVTVTDKNGLRGTLEMARRRRAAADAATPPEALVHLDSGQKVVVPVEMLVERKDGSYFLPLSLAELQSHNADADVENSDSLVLPVIVEEIEVEKRRVETGGVRITKSVREQEEVVDEPLLQEHVDVQRVAVNRLVEGPVPVRYMGDVMIVPLLEEVLVVEKRLMLREELHITKRQVETHEPQRVILRAEEVAIERVDFQKPGEDGDEV